MEKKLVSVAEAAVLLGVNKNKVGELIKFGFIPCLLLGSRKVRPESIDAFLKKYEGCDLTNLKEIKRLPLNNNLTVLGEKINA